MPTGVYDRKTPPWAVATDATRKAYKERPRSVTVKDVAEAGGLSHASQVSGYTHRWFLAKPTHVERMERIAKFLGVEGRVWDFVPEDLVAEREESERIRGLLPPMPKTRDVAAWKKFDAERNRIYAEEMAYTMKHGAKELTMLFAEDSTELLDINRPNACKKRGWFS